MQQGQLQGDFSRLPKELFYKVLENLDFPTLWKLKMTSNGMNQQINQYLSNKFPIESHVLSDYTCQDVYPNELKNRKFSIHEKDILIDGRSSNRSKFISDTTCKSSSEF